MTCEQFRVWNYRENIKATYKDESGERKIWIKNQDELLMQIQQIVQAYMGQKIKLTNRQLYYQLVSEGTIPNADKIYRRICKFLTDARYAGFIDWKAIEDRGRIPEKHSEWESITELIDSAIYSYRLPRWRDQDNYIELYCEKQAMESVLKPIADEYHIYFGYNKGYSSASTMYELADRIKEKIQEGKETIILYLGDHDPSGLDMVRDMKDRIGEFLTCGDMYVEPDFEVIQLALNMKQIKQYDPPPNPAKITDPRAKWYISKYGEKSWELDALKPEVLIQVAEDGILEYLDIDKYNAWIELEKEQKKVLKKVGEKLDEEENRGESRNSS